MLPELRRARMESRLLSMLSEAEELGPDALCLHCRFAGRIVELRIHPPGEAGNGTTPRAPRTACERDIVALLSRATRPMTGVEIRVELEAQEHLWGESTIGQALAGLVNDGVLRNSRKLGGYFVPGPDYPP